MDTRSINGNNRVNLSLDGGKIIVLALIFFLSLKVLRFIPNMSVLWNAAYYLMFVFLLFYFFFFIHRGKANKFDLLITGLLVSFLFSLCFVPNKLYFLSIYVLPMSGYFLSRIYLYRKIPVANLIYSLSIIFSVIIAVEFVTENFLHDPIFQYASVKIPGTIYGGNYTDCKMYPLFGEKFLRPLGPALSPQSSGALMAALILFLLTQFKREPNPKNKRRLLFTLVISAMSLFFTMSGTGFLIVSVGGVLILFGKKNAVKGVVCSLTAGYFMLILKDYTLGFFVSDYFQKVLIFHCDHILKFLSTPNFWYGGLDWRMEIDLFNQLYSMGFLNYSLFVSLIILTLHKITMNRVTFDIQCIRALLLGIIAGSLHYDSVFRFPSSVIVYMMIGYVSSSLIYKKVSVS